MKYLPLKFLMLCTVLTFPLVGAAAEECRISTTAFAYDVHAATVRIPVSELERLREEGERFQALLQHVMLHASPASPIGVGALSGDHAAASAAHSSRDAESRTDGINLHNKNITPSNTHDFLVEIQRFVTDYQSAHRTDSFTIDLSANFIDGSFVEKLMKIIDPIKDRVTELRLNQNELYLRSIEKLAPLLLLDSFKYLTVYSNFIGTERLLSFGAGIYDEDADDGYDSVYLTPEELLRLTEDQRKTCLRKMIWIPKSYFKADANPINVPTDGPISREEILHIHRTYFGLPL